MPLSDLDYRGRAEDEFHRTYAGDDVEFLASYTLFPFGRQYTPRDVAAVLASASVTGVLIFLPPDDPFFGGHPRTNEELFEVFGREPLDAQLASTLSGPGVTSELDLRDPWVRFSACLRDARTGQVVWVATTRTSKMFNAPIVDHFRRTARETVLQLQSDGVIP